MYACELIALLAGYTGWSLEYISQLPYGRLVYLVNVLHFHRQQDIYRLEFRLGQLIGLWAKNNPGPEQIVGAGPQRDMEVTISMTRKLQPQVVVLGDGKEYTLPIIDANLMEAIEEALDRDWQSIFEKLRAKELKVVIHQMLRLQNPNLTLDEVGALLTVDAIGNVGKVLTKLM
jgi:hypothetical protein